MSSSQSQVEYVAHTRIGEKEQITIPKQHRDELLRWITSYSEVGPRTSAGKQGWMRVVC